VERARYEADLAQRRYLHVDPANRLVADSLEADWNEKLRALTAAQEEYEQQRRQDRAIVDEQQRIRIAALASDFPRLWQDPRTPDQERKRMVRLLLADVTLVRGTGITVNVRFTGGDTKTLELPRPLTAWELRTTPADIVSEIDGLTGQYTDKQIAEILNERGALSGCGQRFNSRIIARIRREYNLKPRYDRLREKGLLTLQEMSARLEIDPHTVITRRNHRQHVTPVIISSYQLSSVVQRIPRGPSCRTGPTNSSHHWARAALQHSLDNAFIAYQNCFPP
jgi:hypothetical protein